MNAKSEPNTLKYNSAQFIESDMFNEADENKTEVHVTGTVSFDLTGGSNQQ